MGPRYKLHPPLALASSTFSATPLWLRLQPMASETALALASRSPLALHSHHSSPTLEGAVQVS